MGRSLDVDWEFPMSELETVLADVGESQPGYRHHQREARSTTPLVLPHVVLRWNEVFLTDRGISPSLDRRARACVRSAFANGDVPDGERLGFVVLHHSTARDYLLIGVWYQTQELWEVLFTREAESDEGFRRVHPGIDSSVMCVWEMAAVWHERELWSRYLRSARDLDARLAWARDTWSAVV